MQFRQKKRKNLNRYMRTYFEKPVLVVEDQASLANMLSALLNERWGCDVHIAGSYEQTQVALKQYRHEYHVAVCDLNLPDAPNGEVIDLVHKAKVKAIALTGSFGTSIKEELLQKGIIDFIHKDSMNAYTYVSELVGRLYKNQAIKVLIVDDAKSARDLMVYMLELHRFNIFTASNGIEALSVLGQHPDIRLLVTDYNMPVMDGFNLTVEVRKKYGKEQLAIIGVSGTGDSELSALFIKHGANDFLSKPFSYEELICRIKLNIEMLEYIETIQDIANRDFLTKIYNRRYFFENGAKLHQQAREENLSLTAVMLDLDHFKQINDNYGHDCGDEVLVTFAELLNEHFAEELVARLGGEEFSMLLQSASEDEIQEKLTALCRAVAEKNITCRDKTIPVTVSIGFNRELSDNIDAMLKLADDYLYQAKAIGRNRVLGN